MCNPTTKKENKLPVTYPMITTYTQHAHLLSILTCYESTYDWIFSNYIQLYINRDFKHNWGDFYFSLSYILRPSDTCNWILSKKTERDTISKKWSSIIDFIIDAIDSGNYIHTMVNCFYVPLSRSRYNKKHLNHDIFVYGYSLENETLYVSDFFVGGRYSFKELSFTDFEKAYSFNYLATNDDYLNGLVYTYSIKKEVKYSLSIDNIINSIEAYLNNSVPEFWNMFYNDTNDIVFGNQIYDTLINYITNCAAEIGNNPPRIDIRPFYLLYDHKRIMTLRMKYLYGKGHFKEHFTSSFSRLSEIERQSKVIVNLMAKYNVSNNNEIIKIAAEKLSSLKNKEEDVLMKYIAKTLK